MALAQTTFILPEGDVQHPVQGILDAPVVPRRRQQRYGLGWVEMK